MAAALGFEVARFEYGSGPARGVDPVLGGTMLRALVARLDTRHGQQPADGYGPLLLDAGDVRTRFLRGGRTTLLGCTCGDEGCWPLTADVQVSARTVTWSDFAQPHRPTWTYDDLGPFVVDRSAYEAAVDEVARVLGGP